MEMAGEKNFRSTEIIQCQREKRLEEKKEKIFSELWNNNEIFNLHNISLRRTVERAWDWKSNVKKEGLNTSQIWLKK